MEKIDRISQVVADNEKVVRTLPMKADLRDYEYVKRLIVAVNDAEAQMGLFAPPVAANDEDSRATMNEANGN